MKGRQSKTLTFTQEDTAIGQASSHHGDQMKALGIGPEVIKRRMEGKWIERRSKPREEARTWWDEGKEEEKETEATREEEGVMGEEEKGGEGGGLPAFDVKSLRQKHSRAECCSTCAEDPRCQRQPGDGNDEGSEIKTCTEKTK